MIRNRKLAILLACTSLVVLAASDTYAQRLRGDRRSPVRSVVLLRGYYGYPYSGRFYEPFYSPFFGPGLWYPYPYRFAGVPPYGVPYEPPSAIKLEVKPREAEVYIDGYRAGIVDDFDGFMQRLRLRPGQHDIVLYLEGYRSVRQSLYATPGGDHKIRHTMIPLAAGEPNEARPMPAAPPPQAGPEQPRRQPRGPRGQPSSEPREPLPADASTFGALSIRVQPADAIVLIDGERWRGPEGQDRLLVHLAAGPHRVEVRKDRYVTFSTDVEVRRGETATVNVSLPPQ